MIFYIDPEEVYFTSLFLLGLGIVIFLSLLLIFLLTRIREEDIDLNAKLK
ncbi:MAG: hypothetical protein ACP6IY_02515 [Promethearchaeia archaeon]